MGGVGTDPNSMIPMLLVIGAGYVALTRVPAEAEAVVAPPLSVRQWRRAVSLDPAFVLRAVAAVAAFGIVLIGAVPMALATTRSNADAILTTAINGPVDEIDFVSTQVRPRGPARRAGQPRIPQGEGACRHLTRLGEGYGGWCPRRWREKQLDGLHAAGAAVPRRNRSLSSPSRLCSANNVSKPNAVVEYAFHQA